MKTFKKIITGFALFSICLLFVGCKSKEITATYSNLEISRNKIEMDLKVNAPVNSNNKIKKCIRTYLRSYNDEGEISSDIYKKDLSVQQTEISITGLDANTKYQFSVETCDGEALVLYKEDLTTIIDGENEENPIHIKTPEEFLNIKNDLSAYYVLDNDLDFTDVTYEPIGNTTNRFSGTLDGNNYSIKNVGGIKFDTSSQKAYGLIAVNEGTIKNLKINGFSNSHKCNEGDNCEQDPSKYTSNYNYTDFYLGALVGQNRGVVDNVQATNVNINVRSEKKYTSYDFFVGGLIGLNNGTVKNSNIENSKIDIYEIKRKASVGGLIGQSQPNTSLYRVPAISNSYSVCDINLYFNYSGDMRVGGFVGESEGSEVLTDCYSNSNITVKGKISSTDEFLKDLGVGGFAGYFSSTRTVKNIYAAGQINVDLYNMARTQIGGLVGAIGGVTEILNSFTTVNMNVVADKDIENVYVNEIGYTNNIKTISSTVYTLGSATMSYTIKNDTGEIVKNVERVSYKTNFDVSTLEELGFSSEIWNLIQNAPTLK